MDRQQELNHLQTCIDSLNAICEENHILREQYRYPHPNSHAKLLANYSREVTKRKTLETVVATMEKSQKILDRIIGEQGQHLNKLKALVNEKDKKIRILLVISYWGSISTIILAIILSYK